MAGIAATPAPVAATIAGEAGSLLAIEMLPEAALAAVGVKVTVRVVLWPAANVNGTEAPLSAKPVPEAEACETVMAADPVLVNVRLCLLLAPSATLPKFSAAGLIATAPVVGAFEFVALFEFVLLAGFSDAVAAFLAGLFAPAVPTHPDCASVTAANTGKTIPIHHERHSDCFRLFPSAYARWLLWALPGRSSLTGQPT